MSKDTYMVKVEDHAGIFAFNRGNMKGEALKKAQKFAESKGMIATPISMKEHPVGILSDWASVEYQFRLVPKNSKMANGGKLLPRPDVVIQKNISTKIKNTSENLYTKLMKLDDLRKKGILTEKEFNKEKEKLLNNQ